MNTPVVSHLDELALQTTIEDYGGCCIATIPGCADLSHEDRLEIAEKAQQLQAGSSLNADRLIAALRDVTPSIDEQAEREDAERREIEARQKLEADGCPPCYPQGVDIYLPQDIPEAYRSIVGYWQSFFGWDDVPLCLQLRAWSRFRTYQQQIRRHSFEDYENEVRQRRQRHGLDENVRLTMDLDQQSPLNRWIEFQNYQLKRHEGFVEKRDELSKELTEPQLPDDAYAIKCLIQTSERDIKRHKILLHWVEQERQSMHLTGHDTESSIRKKTTSPKLDSTRVLRRRKGMTETPVARNGIHKEARISRTETIQKQRTRRETAARRVLTQEEESDIGSSFKRQELEVTSQKSKGQRRAGSQNAKQSIRRGNSTDKLDFTHQPTSHRVTKSRAQPRGQTYGSQAGTITRYGRKSKPPKRWGYE
ncbi:hypothetical protein F4802DRAFT_50389 [Xylaria palmicola]|nr:hypothetical protein F4802DRAFT_50389 [Xylaria palmicola]